MIEKSLTAKTVTPLLTRLISKIEETYQHLILLKMLLDN